MASTAPQLLCDASESFGRAALALYGPPEVLLRLRVIPERPHHGKGTEGGGHTALSRFDVSFPCGKAPEASAAEEISAVFLLDALLDSNLPADHGYRESRNIFPVLFGWRLFQRSSVIRGKTRPPPQ